MTVSPMARCGKTSCAARWRLLPAATPQTAGGAVGEAAIPLTPPPPSVLKHLLEEEGGAAE